MCGCLQCIYEATLIIGGKSIYIFFKMEQRWQRLAARALRQYHRAQFRIHCLHQTESTSKNISANLDREYECRWGALKKIMCACGGEMVKAVKKTRSADEGGQVVLQCKVCGKIKKVGVT